MKTKRKLAVCSGMGAQLYWNLQPFEKSQVLYVQLFRPNTSILFLKFYKLPELNLPSLLKAKV